MTDFTLGSMYWINPKYSLDDFRADMRRIRENKITLLRIFIQWEYVEVERNKFDFSFFDTFFRAAEEEGIGVMPTLLFYLPFHRLVEQKENGRADTGRRYPCLDRPEIREGLERFFTETVRHFKDSPSLKMWSLWNEPTDGICKCPDSLEKFAFWLKRKYPTLDELKENWAGEYSIFNPIIPRSMDELNAAWLGNVLDLPLRGRDTAMRLDWFDFQLENSAEHLAFLAGLVRKYDKVHPLHSNPACTATNPVGGSGTSPWKLAKVQESTGGSIHPHGFFPGLENDRSKYPRAMLSVIDLVRSWVAGGEGWIGEYQGGSTFEKPCAYTPRGTDISATLYHALARGLRGLIFWEWQSWRSGMFEPGEFSLRNPTDCGPTERSNAAAQFGAFLEKYKPNLAKLQPPQPKIAILHSMDQFGADALLYSPNIPVNRHFQAAFACQQTLAKGGIPVDFITESQLSEGVLKQYRILILPQVRMIAPSTAAAIEEFVRGGGAIWADGRCGFLDKHMFLRHTVPGNGLDRVFGCREIDEVAPRENDLLILKDGSTVKPHREIQRLKVAESAEILAECNGYPAAVRNRYGKGNAELWGTYLSANPETDFSAILLGFAKANGVMPDIRLNYGKDVIVSMLRGENNLLAVFTSLVEREQSVTAELPIQNGRILNGASAVLAGNTVEFTLSPDETLPLLIQTE
ncbi:MAG: beta-galactosidase [Victivallales bacterium]|nr:beta-galactosidase [Victivallales bacterium]